MNMQTILRSAGITVVLFGACLLLCFLTKDSLDTRHEIGQSCNQENGKYVREVYMQGGVQYECRN